MIWTTKSLICVALAGCLGVTAIVGAVKYEVFSQPKTAKLIDAREIILDDIRDELRKQTALLTRADARQDAMQEELAKRRRVDTPAKPEKW